MGKSKNGIRSGSGGVSHSNGSNGYTNGHGNGASHHHKSKPQSPPSPPTQQPSSFSINLSGIFILLTFLGSIIIAFSVGWVARLILLSHLGLYPYTTVTTNANYYHENDTTGAIALPSSGSGMSKKNSIELLSDSTTMSGKKQIKQLPAPSILEGKEVPFTTYASKTFQMEGAATSHTLHIDRSTAMISRSKKEFDGGPDFQDVENNNNEEGAQEDEQGELEKGEGWQPVPCESNACSRGKDKPTAESVINANDGHNDDSDELHLPAGQHLLVDIKDVDSNFLNDEERLAKAMIELTEETKLTLLSYHCHSLVPIGVSCAGVLLESHVAFHTWPLEGVITMDLFTCGGGLLIPTLPVVEKLFAIPGVPGPGESMEDVTPPTMLWSHKLRGFREGFAPGYVRSKNPLDGSLGRYVLGKLDFDIKRPLLSAKTKFQSVNIYEVMGSKTRDVNSYHKSLLRGEESDEEGEKGGTSYEATYPESFGPDKVLFLDGIVQSTLYGDAAYHESIVHPAMIAHANPQRVAIIGGGEGATLREVLKYRSVTEVVIFEIDEELVSICAEYMPEWSDCTDIEGSEVRSCFDDGRARIVYVDAFKWFLDKFGTTGGEEDDESDKFDVVIMDALDPNTSVEIAGGLYNDTSFVDSLFSGLTEEGVFVVQMGKSKMSTDPPDDVGRFKDTGLMIKALEQSGFGSIHTYDEGHSHFYMPWSYLVALKKYESRANWHRTAPEIQIDLQRRLYKTKSGRPILRYFDAATMVSYQTPSKAQESTYCRRDDEPWECEEFRGIDPEYVGLPASEYLTLRKSTHAEHAGRGIFAAKDIPQNATLALDEAGKSFHFPPSTWSVLDSLYEWGEKHEKDLPYVEDELTSVHTFADGYGSGATIMGKVHYAVESGIMLFMNHGCNGTFNYGYQDEDDAFFTEHNADVDNLAELKENRLNRAIPYSPVYERNLRHLLNSGNYALRNIKKGEEVLYDYLSITEMLKEDVIHLRKLCQGEDIGRIREYENQ